MQISFWPDIDKIFVADKFIRVKNIFNKMSHKYFSPTSQLVNVLLLDGKKSRSIDLGYLFFVFESILCVF